MVFRQEIDFRQGIEISIIVWQTALLSLKNNLTLKVILNVWNVIIKLLNSNQSITLKDIC